MMAHFRSGWVLNREGQSAAFALFAAPLWVRWFETDDFSIHYSEQYRTRDSWECRWDRHPNNHNTCDHFHPPPDAPTPGEDEDYPDEWGDVLATVLSRLDDQIEAFWTVD